MGERRSRTALGAQTASISPSSRRLPRGDTHRCGSGWCGASPPAGPNFLPLPPNRATGPRIYSRILDAAYGALKRVSRRNLVIGGNTFTGGDVRPRRYIRSMRLPGGRPPRMDLYGHNPFTARRPALRRPNVGYGYADFQISTRSQAGSTAIWVAAAGVASSSSSPSSPCLPTTSTIHSISMCPAVLRPWLGAALRITRRWPRIYTFGWNQLYDEPPNGPGGRPGNETNWGLLDWHGRPKPEYQVYKRG